MYIYTYIYIHIYIYIYIYILYIIYHISYIYIGARTCYRHVFQSWIMMFFADRVITGPYFRTSAQSFTGDLVTLWLFRIFFNFFKGLLRVGLNFLEGLLKLYLKLHVSGFQTKIQRTCKEQGSKGKTGPTSSKSARNWSKSKWKAINSAVTTHKTNLFKMRIWYRHV